MRVMKYLNGTRSEYLTLSADDLRVVKWYVDASFVVHPDFNAIQHRHFLWLLGAIKSALFYGSEPENICVKRVIMFKIKVKLVKRSSLTSPLPLERPSKQSQFASFLFL
jgi:hypothetical protein